MIAFRISQGDLPKITYTLTDDRGPVDLSGGTVQFRFQGASVSYTRDATVVNAATGEVEYQTVAEDTAIPGTYQAQWVFVKDAVNQTFPTGSANNDETSGEYIVFEIVETIPFSTTNLTRISDTFEVVRAILGDFKRRRYEDTAIASVIRSCVRMGKVPGYTITADNRFISPAIATPRELALLVLNAAKMFVMPNAASYSYRLRSMSESFGNQRDFIFDLENQLADAEGGRVFHTFQSLYDWVGATAGVNIWSVMMDMRINAPVGNVTLGVGGVQVNMSA